MFFPSEARNITARHRWWSRSIKFVYYAVWSPMGIVHTSNDAVAIKQRPKGPFAHDASHRYNSNHTELIFRPSLPARAHRYAPFIRQDGAGASPSLVAQVKNTSLYGSQTPPSARPQCQDQLCHLTRPGSMQNCSTTVLQSRVERITTYFPAIWMKQE